MPRQIVQRATKCIFMALLALCSTSILADADAAYSVVVISESNDNIHSDCESINDITDGPPEVTLDLDGDGTHDICISSASSSCSGTVNFDCSSADGNSDCSGNPGRTFMDGDASVGTNNGSPVGPNFYSTVDSINASLSTPLVVGFQGASSNPNLTGYFEVQINVVNPDTCSYSFGNSYVDDGRAGINYGDTTSSGADGGAPTAVPTMSLYGLMLTALGLLLVVTHRLRELANRN